MAELYFKGLKVTHRMCYSLFSKLEAVGLMYALKSIEFEWLVQCRHVTVITDNTAVLHIQDWSGTHVTDDRDVC